MFSVMQMKAWLSENGIEADSFDKKIKTGGKRYKWHLSTVRGILRNEKYMGDALLQKTITTDFIEKIRIKNDGTVPQYYVKDSQEPIIARDIFTQVQEELILFVVWNILFLVSVTVKLFTERL